MSKQLKNHLGKKLKKIRSFKGLTQEQLATKIGKSRPLISFFERTGNINKYTLQEIIQALDINLEVFDEMETDTTMVKGIEIFSKSQSKDFAIISLEKENEFLKATIQAQQKIIEDLVKKIKPQI